MPSGRRPPPPPPPRESGSAPPPLPSRNPGNSKLVAEADDTYEQPACPPNVNNNSASKLPNLSLPVDNYDCDDWSDSEWNDSPDLDVPITLQSDDTYITPDGGIVPDDQYNLPNETPTKLQKAMRPRAAVPSPPVSDKANVSREDKSNIIGIKLLPDTNRPKPPPNKPIPIIQPKPVVKPKPSKPSESSLPMLPPRPGERHLKTLESKNKLEDSTNSGSVSSESNTLPQDTKVHHEPPGMHLKSRVLVFPVTHEGMKKTAFQAKAGKIDAILGKKVADDHQSQEAPIYDDGISEVLSKFDWFHGELDREEGAKRVKKLYENGVFLIRASKSDGTNNSHPYTLVVTWDHKVYNLKIRLRHDNRFAIGTYKSDEVSFPTVPELVEHHKENNIKLAEGGAVKLQRTPKK